MLKSYFSPKAEIREKSEIQGRGLFAKEDIRAGEIIFAKGGHLVTTAEAVEIESRLGEYCLQIYHNLHLCPTTSEEVSGTAICINHSCDPNVGADGQMTFVAMRDIKADEELCYDYAMTTDRNYRLECHCGAGNCRKEITGQDWKRKDLQQKYGQFFSYYILRRIQAEGSITNGSSGEIAANVD